MNSYSTASAPTRRTFLKGVAALAGVGVVDQISARAANPQHRLKLGFDNFAVRDMKWNAVQLIEYGAKLKVDSIFITDFGPFEKRDDASLGEIRKRAEDQGMQIQLGSWSICPTAKSFRKDWGTAEEHLRLGLRMAKALGSPVFRVILGNGDDRKSAGGIEARIEDTVAVCRACRNQSLDSGVKIAVENHAGDMQARELVTLIEAAGRDYVGANLDSGNACWTMEDPLRNLEILGPYVLTTSLRDSMIWEYEKGVAVQWTAMGEGIVDFKSFFEHFIRVCPNAPVHIETISGFTRRLALFENEFWTHWPKMEARDLARFMALAKKGKAIPEFRAPNPQAGQEYQKGEIERSIAYCKNTLGLGRRM